MTWRFFATTLNGDGTEDMLIGDLPLGGSSITRRLSGADSIAGSIAPEIGGLKDADGRPLIKSWSTAIYAEKDGQIKAGTIVQPESPAQGSSFSVDAAGFSHYPTRMPYDSEIYFVETDALDIFRHIWEHLQSQPGGNLGLVLDRMRSGVLIGEELEEVTFETSTGEEVFFEAGPFRLNWYSTDDLSERLAELQESGGFEYREEHRWTDAGLVHHLRFGVPRLGRRRMDLHFVAGDNLVVEPAFSAGEYASEVWALGAGEGRMMRNGRAARSDETRLRRVAVVSDKALTSNRRAAEMATTALRLSTGLPEVDSVQIRNTDLPDLGDEILLKLNGVGWHGEDEIWVRVLSITERPESSVATCEVQRVD